MYLYETHLPVISTEVSKAFYVDIVGLRFAYRDPKRDIIFLWVGENRISMLGLWGPGTDFGSPLHKCHLAIAMPLVELLAAGKRLNDLGVPTHNFANVETTKPSVIGWMPSAQFYFQDPNGHLLEFISLLDERNRTPTSSALLPSGGNEPDDQTPRPQTANRNYNFSR